MKIALLIHSLQGGGAERLMSNLANRWVTDHDVHLVTWSAVETDQYPLDGRVSRHGLDLMRPSRGLLSGLIANLGRVRKLHAELREIDPDLVLSFSDQMNIAALEAGRVLQVPQWIAEHSNPEQQKLSALWELWRRRVYPRCTGCVVLTKSIRDYVSRWVPRHRIRVIPPALSTVPESNNYLSREGGKKTILYVGRLSPEKCVEVLIEAWKRAQGTLAEWRLVIVGDGPQREKLERLAKDCQRVFFEGWVQQPEAFYQQADLFVLSSRYEGFPVALLEAMSYGVPCLATDCSSALSELQRSGGTLSEPVTRSEPGAQSASGGESASGDKSLSGDPSRDDVLNHDLDRSSAEDVSPVAIVSVGDVQALADAMSRLCRDEAKLAGMSKAAWHVSKRYSWREVGKQWDELLS